MLRLLSHRLSPFTDGGKCTEAKSSTLLIPHLLVTWDWHSVGMDLSSLFLLSCKLFVVIQNSIATTINN